MATVPYKIKGKVPRAKYEFVRNGREDNAIKHGTITIQTIGNIEASFLHFKNLNEATNVHHNLSLRLKGESFLRSHFVIDKEDEPSDFWVAVEKIDCSLEDYTYPKKKIAGSLKDYTNPNDDTKSKRMHWIDSNTRLTPNYQDIIRDIIRGMCLLHQQDLSHGNLSSKSIMIINHRAKLAFITNDSPRDEKDDFKQLNKMFKEVLGEKKYHDELTHFHAAASVNHWSNLRKLYFHPLLMSRGERFLLPITTHTRLDYRRHGITIQIFRYASQFCRELRWTQVSCNQENEVYARRKPQNVQAKRNPQNQQPAEYKDTSWDQFSFVRNNSVHINGNIREENERRKKENERRKKEGINEGDDDLTLLQIKTEAEIESDLSSMFPYFLSRVYDFFDLHEITPCVRLHMGDLK